MQHIWVSGPSSETRRSGRGGGANFISAVTKKDKHKTRLKMGGGGGNDTPAESESDIDTDVPTKT